MTARTVTAHARHAKVNGTRLYYELAGAGEAVVLVHAWAADLRAWDPQFEPFARLYRVLRYDLRGFGRSGLPTGVDYSHYDDLRALLQHAEVERAHVLGQGFGGGVAINFTLTYPEMVASLVLVHSVLPGYRFSESFSRFLKTVWAAAKERGAEAAKEAILSDSVLTSGRSNPRSRPLLERTVREYSGWHFFNEDPARGLDPPAIERLAEIRAPTLVLVGDHDDPDFHTIGDLLEQGIDGARKVVVRGGPVTNMEDPEGFNAVVLDFISSTRAGETFSASR